MVEVFTKPQLRLAANAKDGGITVEKRAASDGANFAVAEKATDGDLFGVAAK